MAERKQRIMRRYLRERSNIVQSDLEVPVARPEDEVLAESEQYKETQVNLQHQAAGTPIPPPPPPRQPPTQTKNRNWLLAADPLLSDPFSPADTEESPKKKTDWSIREQEQSPYGGAQYESWFSRKNKEVPVENGSRYGSRQEGLSTSRGYNPFSFGGNSFGTQQQETVPRSGYPSLFGRKQEGTSGSGFGTLDLSRERTYNPNQNQGYLKNPLLPSPSANKSMGTETERKGYVPYKSPYETRRQQQQQQQWNGQNQQEQEYKRVNPYQEWKKRTPVYNPTDNDAFINEYMPKSKR